MARPLTPAHSEKTLKQQVLPEGGMGGEMLGGTRDLSLLAKAIENNWDIPDDVKHNMPLALVEIMAARKPDGHYRYSTRSRMMAMRLMEKMHKDNQSTYIQAATVLSRIHEPGVNVNVQVNNNPVMEVVVENEGEIVEFNELRERMQRAANEADEYFEQNGEQDGESDSEEDAD